MADPSSPVDIRAHIRYDKYHGISAENSYSNYKKLCITFGKEAISYEEYESLFDQYFEESNYNARYERFKVNLISDIRGCILSDVINGKSVEISYKDLCETFGSDNIERHARQYSIYCTESGREDSIDDLCREFKRHKIHKEDHGYWYKRFENGHLFNRVTFSDLPEDVFAEIVEKCDIKSYLNLRNVSRGLRSVVDQLAPPCCDIKVDCGQDSREDFIHVFLNDTLMANSLRFKTSNSYLPIEDTETPVPGTLALLLRNPKLRVKSFTFFTYSGRSEALYTKIVINLLNSFNRKIHVESCFIGGGSVNDLIGILQSFKPGTLEKIDFFQDFPFFIASQIVEMDQWKQAKHLRLYGDGLPPMEHFLHFSTIEYIGSIPLTDFVKLCDSISKSSSFKQIKMQFENGLDTEEVKRVLNLQPTASPQIYSIPNSNLFFHVLIDRFGLESYKITKN
ncbi:hypothetical protein GCK72_021207 [Caenorhabditis remanei]|uniref:F-box domain-containing protein n=1 Tax=Caenorhabditis remanei TaxID=31234 RepID=A0A6A5GIM5_CAERE|nr:hypothetical protein GCK72_021207 [Caenorhabditis remanei]KAF1754644.1 hypothetical protein GCK72_021207 [Caenorhabditis remanei]